MTTIRVICPKCHYEMTKMISVYGEITRCYACGEEFKIEPKY